MKPSWLFLILLIFLSCEESVEEDRQTFPTVFEESQGKQTATYQEVVDFYLALAKEYAQINVQTIGNTDSGRPLHLVTYNPDGNFNFQKIREDRSILLINNGIHPGEPDGIDASMLLFRDLAQQKLPTPKNLVVATIPVYNVGGMLNRNTTSRVNQNGPESYGFRGNALNYDLNRDFVKMDTENAKTFSEIFHLVQPDVFIDNHVSNGADYQYVLTHLFTQHNKLGSALGEYLEEELMPKLEADLKRFNFDITPYVNVFNTPPDNGFSQFMDHPRYSTGYTTLWNTLGMMVETHMLKPYKPRVEGTYALMNSMIKLVDEDHKKIRALRKEALTRILKLEKYPINWQLDTTKVKKLNFKGFVADTIVSEISGMPRLKYDQNQPFEKAIPYSNQYIALDSIEMPEGYLVKKGWKNIINRLNANEISYTELEADTLLTVGAYTIEEYGTYSRPYEGHYPHYNTKVSHVMVELPFQKGDILVPTQQEGIRYLLETLEPQAVDSFFNWNFFDTVLQQKEGFSPYVFEDLALEILKENPVLKDSLLKKQSDDERFANSGYAQLNWIYKNSKYAERAHLQYPIYRIIKGSDAVKLLKD